MTQLSGMSSLNGSALTGDAHLSQSVADIITTPLGSRLMRRDYGCLLFKLMDQPMNRATVLLCSMAIAIAIARWEPRIVVKSVQFEGDLAAGQATVIITGNRTDVSANALTRLSIPISR